ncbi:unnamed protein product [Paramecium pentaurelia]|uniref:Uncharacterized protein n=1 Tax=Paramecium pentaurelia TaxID=43138 RepID=A0A8S1T5I2_9CILI|nr:unnamed protein product [Paramecium pentaurelia]
MRSKQVKAWFQEDYRLKILTGFRNTEQCNLFIKIHYNKIAYYCAEQKSKCSRKGSKSKCFCGYLFSQFILQFPIIHLTQFTILFQIINSQYNIRNNNQAKNLILVVKIVNDKDQSLYFKTQKNMECIGYNLVKSLIFWHGEYQFMPYKLQQGLVGNDKPFPKQQLKTNKQQYTTAYTRQNQQQQNVFQQQQQSNKIVQKKK